MKRLDNPSLRILLCMAVSMAPLNCSSGGGGGGGGGGNADVPQDDDLGPDTGLTPNGGDPDSGEPGADALTLSATQADPGGFLTVSHASIETGETVVVVFGLPDGSELEVEAVATSAGSVRVSVPPVISPTAGTFGGGELVVSIKGNAASAGLAVSDLPDLGEELEPGTVLRLFWEAAIESNESALTGITGPNSDFPDGPERTAAVAAIQAEIASLSQMRDELESTGQLTVILPDGSSVVLTGESLRTGDRLLTSMLVGVFDELNVIAPLKGTSTLAGSDCMEDIRAGIARWREERAAGIAFPSPPPTGGEISDCIGGMVSSVGDDIKQYASSGSIVTGLAGLVVTGVLVFVASESVVVTGLVVAVIGAGYSIFTAFITDQNTDTFNQNDGQGFCASREAVSQGTRVGTTILGNAPAPVGPIVTTANVFLTLNDINNAGESMKCAESPRRRVLQEIADVVLFCSACDLATCIENGQCSSDCGLGGIDPDCDLCGGGDTCVTGCTPDDPDCDAPPEQPPVTAGGTWSTSFGDMVFNGATSGMLATYGDSAEFRRIFGTLTEQQLDGYWVNDIAAVECDSQRDGSSFWGFVVFTFNEEVDHFEGVWGYCEAEPTLGWSGDQS